MMLKQCEGTVQDRVGHTEGGEGGRTEAGCVPVEDYFWFFPLS